MLRPYLADNSKNTSQLKVFFRKWLLGCCLLLSLLLPEKNFAEGSKELNSNGGNRAFLYSSTNSQSSFPFPTLGTMKVYVKVGETIYLGSSAQGIGTGTINLRSPNGNTYTSGTSTTIGLINSRNQELAGPQPNAGGYNPYTRTVAAGQEGIWEIDFIAPSSSNDVESNPTPTTAVSNWVQPSGSFIAAFDISVRNTANTAFLKGRVFTNVFSGLINNYNTGFYGILHILTKDGYQYDLDNNGQAGNGFCFFVNNKGFRTPGGAASYQSLNNTVNPDVQDPRAPDTQSDITHKIFFNPPALDLPATANTPGGGSTWLANPPFVPSITSVNFTGIEGTLNKSGTAPLGGVINFTATSNGSYTIVIDANHNGVFTDPIDRKLTGISAAGANAVNWDGLDGLGNKLPASTISYTVNITLQLYSAEVHFPFFDVERNVNGMKLTRSTGAGAPDNTIYWDDSQISIIGTPSSPIKNVTGLSSLSNGHKWGSPSADPSNGIDFGDNRSLDTWAYVSSPPITTTVNFVIQEADLEVVNLTSDISTGCVGQKVTYVTVVKNNGPNDVTDAPFSFTFPKELTGVKATSDATTGVSTIVGDTTSTNSYKTKLSIANGAVRTFTITGIVAILPAASLDVTAAILRPADVTDPDATNPDAAIPSDPLAECDSQPSGIGCNNIKTNSTNFIISPNAGADQVVEKNTVATLTANTTGTWAQLGITPSIANINAPASAKTTISGLTDLGPYNFTFTNANGCADTVIINVTSSTIDVHNVVTPNGDGNNDALVIPGIELYPGSKLSIYNRWGNEVFHSDNYANNWAGQGLAEGTYFYMYNRKEKTGEIKVFKGWIYLKH
ncbi:gliding motility-associated C-terminal domain-containing protein [Mucilaginibacter sp. UR6-11]|uniref:T9SS type B sorting domain-containing protein n=1 Tax=Mucilaginibacter sp. UR6-11 TaxID=1435644 RepID=UPI001E353F28|nr:gliding motility-associated C-terminal domain-containing protein [Mucilaginibacter sp. UR6-11]MCC8425839.1 gliding motility-associated C-terminal domain-containing protein [Mucilaginibacter sp. UR6-11]